MPASRPSAQPGSTVLRDREALVRVVRTCGEETEPNPDGERPGKPDEMQRPRQMNDPG